MKKQIWLGESGQITESEVMGIFKEHPTNTPLFVQFDHYVIMNMAAFKDYEQSFKNRIKIKTIKVLVNGKQKPVNIVHQLREMLNNE